MVGFNDLEIKWLTQCVLGDELNDKIQIRDV